MGTSVTLSEAGADDAEQILKLQYLCYQREADRHRDHRIAPLTQTLAQLHEEMAAGHVLVARLGGEVVGTVRAVVDREGTARISRLCVHPRLQGHGLAARLMTGIESALTGRGGARRLRLAAGERSDGFLRLCLRLGYTPAGTEQDRRIMRVVMEKEAGAVTAVSGAATSDPSPAAGRG